MTLSEAKQLPVQVQQQVVADQATTHAAFRPNCRSCGGTCHVKDWQPHRIATLFGEVNLKLPRFLCAGCGCGGTGVSRPSHCRSTPEVNQLQARLSALMPIDAWTSPETFRSHTLQVGQQLGDAVGPKSPAAGLGKIWARELRYTPTAGPERKTMRDELERFRSLTREGHAPDCFR
jgi:hypothetical protein